MEWLPRASVEIVKEAVPLLNGMLPDKGEPPSRNCTAPFPVGVTVAVKTKVSPITEGFAPELKVTARLDCEVRKSTGLFRGFCRTIGQSLLAATKGE